MRTMTAEDYLTEWLVEAFGTATATHCLSGGYKVTVTLPDGNQFEGRGGTLLAAMAACDLAMSPHFSQLAGEPVAS